MKFSKVAIVLALATTASAKLVAPTQSNQTLANTKIDIMSNGTEVSTADFSKNDTQALIHASAEAKLEFDKIKHLKEVDETLKEEIKRENNVVEKLNNEVFIRKYEEKEAK